MSLLRLVLSNGLRGSEYGMFRDANDRLPSDSGTGCTLTRQDRALTQWGRFAMGWSGGRVSRFGLQVPLTRSLNSMNLEERISPY